MDSSFEESTAGRSPFARFFDLSTTLNASTVKIRDALQSPGQNRDIVLGALGNALLLVFLLALFLVYRIMEHFVRPIVWALLVGAGLFPLKAALKRRLKQWLEGTSERLLATSLLRMPGSVSATLVSWVRWHWLGLLAVGGSVTFCLMVETIYNGAKHVLEWLPGALHVLSVGLNAWSEFSSMSLQPMLMWSLLLGVPLFVLLRRHDVALTVLSSLAWLLLVLWVFPTAYAMVPTLTVAALVGWLVLVGMGVNARSLAALRSRAGRKPSVAKELQRGSRADEKTSSSMVLFLAVGCFGVLFMRYLPYVVVCTLLLSQFNPVWDYLIARVKVPSASVMYIVFPPPVRFVADLVWRGDVATRQSLSKHADSIATLLTLVVFMAGAAVTFVWASVSIYQEVQEIGHNATTAFSGATGELVPGRVNEIMASLVAEGTGWVEKNLLTNATSLALSAKLFNFSSTSSTMGFSIPTDFDWNTLVSVFDSLRDSGKQVSGGWALFAR